MGNIIYWKGLAIICLLLIGLGGSGQVVNSKRMGGYPIVNYGTPPPPIKIPAYSDTSEAKFEKQYYGSMIIVCDTVYINLKTGWKILFPNVQPYKKPNVWGL